LYVPILDVLSQMGCRDFTVRPVGFNAKDLSATSRHHGLGECSDMCPHVNDDVAGSENVRQSVLVEFDHRTEYCPIERTIAKLPSPRHQPLAD
jgi:hypothetical protein